MESGIIPPNMHYKNPRKEISSIVEGRIKVVTEPTKWEGGYMAINSFGLGGSNGHILLKSNPKNKLYNVGSNDKVPRLVCASARTETAVKTMLDDVRIRNNIFFNRFISYQLSNLQYYYFL